MQSRQWLQHLQRSIFNPDLSCQGSVLLLNGHVDDLFFHSAEQPETPLYKILAERFCHRPKIDAFIWYQMATTGTGELHYELNRFPDHTGKSSPQPARAPTILQDLDNELRADGEEWQAQNQGRRMRNCSFEEAIQEITPLLGIKGYRAVVFFHDIHNWGIQDNGVLNQLQLWPRLCEENYHLVVFGLRSEKLSWVKTCFGELNKGISRTAVAGPTPDEVKAYLLYRHLCVQQILFDWHLLDEISNQFSLLAAEPDNGFRMVIKLVNQAIEQGRKFDQVWLDDNQSKIGHTTEKVYLNDIVLSSDAHGFLQDNLLPALCDPQYRKKAAELTDLAESDIDVPNRVLLFGPPGTGKTTIAKVIATESKMPFFSVKASDFQSTYRGGPVEKVAQHFANWRQNAPCVVFWDEVEAVAGKRLDSQHEDNPIRQILAELESTSGKDENVVIICATNLPEKLDPAFTERFQKLAINYPDMEGYKKLVKKYFKTHKFAPDVTIEKVAQLFDGRSPRALQLCHKYTIQQLVRQPKSQITLAMIQDWLRLYPVDEYTA